MATTVYNWNTFAILDKTPWPSPEIPEVVICNGVILQGEVVWSERPEPRMRQQREDRWQSDIDHYSALIQKHFERAMSTASILRGNSDQTNINNN